MHKRTAIAAAIVFATAGLLATPLALADPPSPPAAAADMPQQAGAHEHHAMAMFDQLNLSDTQRANIRAILKQHHQQARPMEQDLRQKRAAVASATPGTPAYQSAADALAQAEASAKQQRKQGKADLRTQIDAVLTPDQRAQLTSLQAQHRAQMRAQRRSGTQGTPPAGDDDSGS